MGVVKKLVVIGGGFGGLRVVYDLSDYVYRFEITVVDKSEYSLEKPALFEVALEGKDKQDVNIFIPPLLREHICGYSNEEVESIDKQNHKVLLKNGDSLKYDYLVISSGMQNSFNIKGFNEYGYSICNTTEAKELHNALKNFKGKSATIYLPKNSVFEGIAIELSFRLKERLKEAQITLILEDELLKEFSKENQDKVKALLDEHSIKVLENKELVEIDANSVTFADNSKLDSNLNISFPTLKVPEFISKSGLETNEKGVITDDKMKVNGSENIFAIGDVNAKANPKLGFITISQADVVSSYLTNIEDVEDPMEPIEFSGEILYAAAIDKLEGLLLYKNGEKEKVWVSPLAKFMKMGFTKEYYYTNGKLPPQGAIKRLEKILESIK